MKSPFPGMDPYLERYWTTVHFNLLGAMQRLLRPLLPPGLVVRAEEQVLLEGGFALPPMRPDYMVVERVRAPETDTAVATLAARAAATTESYMVTALNVPRVQRDLRIINVTENDQVVTAIEVLSPWNKSSEGSREYRRKLDQYRSGGVNIVEIDLIRTPARGRLEVGQEDLEPSARTPYLACVYRTRQHGKWQLFPLRLRQPLPLIPVPLRETDHEIDLDLQASLHAAFDECALDERMYRHPLEPSLRGEDATWAAELLRTHRLGQ